jgi:hypothetical protein
MTAEVEPQFAYLTVEALAAQLVGLIRNGAGNAIVCTRHNGKNYDVAQLAIGKLPKILTLVSCEDMIRFEDEPPVSEG